MRLPSTIPRSRLLAALFMGVMVLLGAGDDSARLEKLGHQMMCMCGCNQILLECNHVGCTYSSRMREELAAAVDSGKDDNSVLQVFIAKYGSTVLAAPTKTGFDRIAWIMPYLALILGLGGVFVAVHHWHQRRPEAGRVNDASTGDPELERFRAQARRETEL
jgi:cytochrome c-type biogenesis protein CcmH/NrfF